MNRFVCARRAVAVLALAASVAAPSRGFAADDNATQDVLVVIGAPGIPEYAEGFAGAADAWRTACNRGGAKLTVIGISEQTDPDAAPTDKDRMHEWLQNVAADGPLPAWVVYVGHGTFDGRETRLNLRGPDITLTELQQWLARLQRPLVVVHGGSASGPAVPALSGPNRVVIAATTSGDEVNYARFGERFAQAVASSEADIDQDGQTTLLEAYLAASQQVELFYAEAGRMASEHALLDDNGDKRGTPPDWFRGTRAIKRAQDGAAPDGASAHRIALVENAAERALTPEQRAARDVLEAELEKLRARKESLPEREYLRELEIVLRKLSAIYVPEPVEEDDPPPTAPAPDASVTAPPSAVTDS